MPEFDRGREALRRLADAFRESGWRVREPPERAGGAQPDLLVERGKARYAVELKIASESRRDRLIPLWSQAYLQARRASDGKHVPLVVVAAPHVNRNTADQVLAFVADHAPDVAAGVVDLDGLRRFRGGALDVLDADHDPSLRKALPLHAPLPDLYSDLNQWMLKVLLAAELPPGLVSAPRERSRDASQLARNAGVSVMSASRLVRQLKHQGHLEEKGPWLQLVRKEELLERWSAASDRPATELRMRFRPGSDGRTALGRLVQHPKVCLALFSAADALGLGLVRGVPPYVYARRLEEIGRTVGDQLVPAEAGEAYHVIVRQPRAVESVFRGMVRRANEWVSDVIQVWLDVSFHPSRGEEQAARIYHKLLAPIIDA